MLVDFQFLFILLDVQCSVWWTMENGLLSLQDPQMENKQPVSLLTIPTGLMSTVDFVLRIRYVCDSRASDLCVRHKSVVSKSSFCTKMQPQTISVTMIGKLILA